MADLEGNVLPAYVEDSDEESAAAAAKQKRWQESRKQWKVTECDDGVSEEERALWEESARLAASYYEYDHKTKSRFFTRACFCHVATVDLDEETQYGPMRFTDSVIEDDHILSQSLNALYLKIVSSDVGYPIKVYGTVIARDMIDRKCITVFRRDRSNCQVIQAENEDLILTGPTRGVNFDGEVFYEINLKIKEDESKDREFSKGLVEMRWHAVKTKIVSDMLVSRLSEVELVLSYVQKALEGTIEIKILSGPKKFQGKITACATDVPNDMLLYDSDVGGASATGKDGVIQLFRRVVAVEVNEMLILNIKANYQNGDVSTQSLRFTPFIRGAYEDKIKCGLYWLRTKVVWSTLCWP